LFQRDSDKSLISEAAVVDQFPELVKAAATACLDTAQIITSIAADNA
jgi:hypothetical protein